MDDLASVVRNSGHRVARNRGQGIGEENTKAALIDPVLRALSGHLEDLDEGRKEFAAMGLVI